MKYWTYSTVTCPADPVAMLKLLTDPSCDVECSLVQDKQPTCLEFQSPEKGPLNPHLRTAIFIWKRGSYQMDLWTGSTIPVDCDGAEADLRVVVSSDARWYRISLSAYEIYKDTVNLYELLGGLISHSTKETSKVYRTFLSTAAPRVLASACANNWLFWMNASWRDWSGAQGWSRESWKDARGSQLDDGGMNVGCLCWFVGLVGGKSRVTILSRSPINYDISEVIR